MKKTFTAILSLALLISCNSEKSETTQAAPQESTANPKVEEVAS